MTPGLRTARLPSSRVPVRALRSKRARRQVNEHGPMGDARIQDRGTISLDQLLVEKTHEAPMP